MLHTGTTLVAKARKLEINCNRYSVRYIVPTDLHIFYR